MDNPINLQMIAIMLEKLDVRPDVAANGLDVLAVLHRQHFDLILTDVQIPQMDGLEAARLVGATRHKEDQPAIVTASVNILPEGRQVHAEAGTINESLPMLTQVARKTA